MHLPKAASDYLVSASITINFMWTELLSNSFFFPHWFLKCNWSRGCLWLRVCKIEPIPSLSLFYFSECKRAVACVRALLLYVPPALSTWKPSPTSSPKLGTVGPMSRCFGIQHAQVLDHQSPGRRNHKYLESAPLTHTISHSWGLSKYPVNKRWQLAGFNPKTMHRPFSLSLHFYSVSVHLFLISIFTFHYPPALSPSLLPSLPPSRLPWKTHFYLAQKINSDCG